MSRFLSSSKVRFFIDSAPLSHISEFSMRGASDSLVFYVELIDNKENKKHYVVESIKSDKADPFTEIHLIEIATPISTENQVIDFRKVTEVKKK